MQSSDEGELLLRGVFIHLFIERDDDGEEKVLVHLGATAQADGSCAPLGHVGGTPEERGPPGTPRRVEDVRIPVLLRRRHESWNAAVTRYCQTQLHCSAAAIERILERCRSAEGEMCTYQCDSPATLCCHHGDYGDGLSIAYDAYRFKVPLRRKDLSLFGSLLDANFKTCEHGANLFGFGGDLTGTGTITREWAWMSREEVERHGVAWRRPPENKLRIIRETGHLNALLIGIEGSAPLKENLFGHKHGSTASSKDVSAFGKRKWRDYRSGGQEVPADFGGIHVNINSSCFDHLQEVCNMVSLSRPSCGYIPGHVQHAEKELFREILQASDESAHQVLYDRLKFTRSSLQGHTHTVVFDTCVRDWRDCLSTGNPSTRSLSSKAKSERTSGSQSEKTIDLTTSMRLSVASDSSNRHQSPPPNEISSTRVAGGVESDCKVSVSFPDLEAQRRPSLISL